MGKSAGKGESAKKAAGNAKKAEVAAQKEAAQQVKAAAAEDADWSKGAKGGNKKDEAEAKKAEAARKKAERDAQLAEEEKGARAAPKTSKTAVKKAKGLDLAQLDSPASSSSEPSALNATGIDNALDALSLTAAAGDKIDRHPERRFKAAYAAFEARRLPEIEAESKGLRRNQRVELCRKEFEKSEENPFNQVAGSYDMSREEIKAMQEAEREKKEGRLGG